MNRAEIEETLREVEEILQVPFRMDFIFSGQMKCSAGKAMGFWKNPGAKFRPFEIPLKAGFSRQMWGVIKLSRSIFNNGENSIEDKRETVVHEACHIVDIYNRQTTDHSYQWKKLMLQCGYSGDRLHEMKIERPNSVSINCAYCGMHYNMLIKTMKKRHKKTGNIGYCTKCRSYSFTVNNAPFKIQDYQ